MKSNPPLCLKFESAKEKWHDTWGLVPDWYIENPEYPVEQYACYLPFSYDEEELKQLCFQSGCYRSVLGQPGFLEYSRSLDSPELLIKYALSFFPQKTM